MLANIVAYGLGVYALSAMLTRYDGPLKVFARIRGLMCNTWLEELVTCQVCAATWIAIIPAALFANSLTEFFIYWLGVVGLIIVLAEIHD